jgi:hypothetical protein
VLHLWSSGGGVTAGLHQNFPVVKNKKKNKKTATAIAGRLEPLALAVFI